MTATRIYYASDIHGSNRCFRKFLNAAKFYQAHVLVMGGDILGKAVVFLEEVTETHKRALATLTDLYPTQVTCHTGIIACETMLLSRFPALAWLVSQV